MRQNIVDTLRHRKGTFFSDATLPYISGGNILKIWAVKKKKKPFPSIIGPPHRFFTLVGPWALPCVFVGSIMRSRGQFEMYWLINAAESLLGENRSVIWLWKIALLQYQLSLYCNAKAHCSWPICSTRPMTRCIFYLYPLSRTFLWWWTKSVYICMLTRLTWFYCLNSPLTGAWLCDCLAALRAVYFPSWEMCQQLNWTDSSSAPAILYSSIKADRCLTDSSFPLFIYFNFHLQYTNKEFSWIGC